MEDRCRARGSSQKALRVSCSCADVSGAGKRAVAIVESLYFSGYHLKWNRNTFLDDELLVGVKGHLFVNKTSQRLSQ